METSIFSPQFTIGSIRIGSVQGASCVNLGNNFPTHFTNHQKYNQGVGNVSGDHNQFNETRSVVDDSDMVDMINETGGELPEWLKRIIQDSQVSD